MPGLMEVFILKDRVNGKRDNIFMMLFEKAFILISLLVVLLIGVALNLPDWGVGALVGAALGPIVYGHYYFIYIRPVKKQQNIDVSKKQGKNKRK
ncbi:hypothetical protein CMO85_00170 [Candidatus Woesearchaeota archaeon]|nr:hypothetical protein [Candidatus Woesearchaeota archaeon]